MKAFVDLLERAGWTAVQAFVGSLTAVSFVDGSVDWRLVLTTAGIAALVAALKVLGVQGSQVSTVVDTAEKIPAVQRWTETTPVGRTSEDIAREVARQLASK